ncbi:MAG: Gfo/Idh/MocA family oxidoreductase [Chloroflexi bacterium]|nr:Gfo/Idh/MocA family oxidoreductase [Chloroflexota bacterium]
MPFEDGRLGVLLLSFASVGGQEHQRTMYVPVLREHPALRLAAVADEASAPQEQHALNRREAEALGLPYSTDLDAALADPRVDVVSVCCPFERRAEVIRRVAAAGKPMLVDKPLALTRTDCDAIERTVRAAGVVCMPAYHFRFHPAVRSARAAVMGGSIGLPWGVQGDFIIAGGKSAWPLGELANFGLYPIDAIRSILGLEVQSVYATRGSFFYGGDNPEADDLSVLALNLEHGVLATISVGRAPTTGHPNGYGGDRRLRIMGSHGTLVVDAARPWIQVAGRDSHADESRRYYGAESLRALVDHFVACVRGSQRPELGPADARAALEVILAARVATAENRVVALPRLADGTSTPANPAC